MWCSVPYLSNFLAKVTLQIPCHHGGVVHSKMTAESHHDESFHHSPQITRWVRVSSAACTQCHMEARNRLCKAE